MADSGNLDELLRSPRGSNSTRGRNLPGPESLSKPAEPKGLNPLDVLSLPPAQRELVNWLARRNQAGISEIQQSLAQEPDRIERVLSDLKEAGYVQEVLIEGQVAYRVVFRGAVSRAGRKLSNNIWNLIDLDNVTFLQQVPLFQSLSRQELERIASKLEERHYSRNQVILWQGDPPNLFYLIKRGVVGVTHLSSHGNAQFLSYLKQGEILGEVGLVTGTSSTATVTALSEVQVLTMKRQDFEDLLANYDRVAVGVARILGQRLAATNARLSNRMKDSHVCVLLGIGSGADCTTLGAAIALTLAQAEGQTVYTEYPAPERLLSLFGFAQKKEINRHPGGYDVFVGQQTPRLPPSVRATLMLDQLRDSYDNIVISAPESVSDKNPCLLDHADQVIIVALPDPASRERARDLRAALKAFTSPEQTSLFTVINHATREDATVPASGQAEDEIPFLESLPPLMEQRYDNLPEPLARVARSLGNRLGRTNQIGVYIPATVGVDGSADTRAYLEKTLSFMGQLFGGATGSQAQGIWSSSKAELVGEAIYIVRSYVTQSDLDRHLPQVIEYAESLKQELKQEAIALEVNQKLMLV
jgi:CRP-like cAMP-binding protein